MKQLMLLLILSLTNRSILNAAEAQGTILSYGIYHFSSQENLIKSSETPSGVTKFTVGTPILIALTNRIPARLGVRFGMFYEITNCQVPDGMVEITKIVRCPAITRPNGTVTRGYIAIEKQPVKDGHVLAWCGYGFDHNYELAAGTWNFEIELEGRTICEQSFDVFKE